MTRTRAIAETLVAMSAMATLSAVAKSLSGAMSVPVILLVQYALIGLLLSAVPANLRGITRRNLIRVAPRTGLTLLGVMLFYRALSSGELSATMALLYTYPILTMIAAAVLFGKRISTIEWLAVFGGFLSVLLIAGPQSQIGTAYIALGTAACVAGRAMLDRRVVVSGMSPGQVQFLGALLATAALLAAAAVYPAGFTASPLELSQLVRLAALPLLGLTAQHLILRVVASDHLQIFSIFAYWEVTFATFLGWSLFAEPMGWAKLLGLAGMVAAGLLSQASKARRAVR